MYSVRGQLRARGAAKHHDFSRTGFAERCNMAPAARKPASQAEVSLLALKNCLVNLPASMVALLANANTVCPSSAGLGSGHVQAHSYL